MNSDRFWGAENYGTFLSAFRLISVFVRSASYSKIRGRATLILAYEYFGLFLII